MTQNVKTRYCYIYIYFYILITFSTRIALNDEINDTAKFVFTNGTPQPSVAVARVIIWVAGAFPANSQASPVILSCARWLRKFQLQVDLLKH